MLLAILPNQDLHTSCRICHSS